MRKEDELSQEDLDRVQNFLNSGYNSVERGPYRPWRLLAVLWVIVTVMGLVALALARFYGVI